MKRTEYLSEFMIMAKNVALDVIFCFMDYFAWPKPLFASLILKTILSQEKGDLSLYVK